MASSKIDAVLAAQGEQAKAFAKMEQWQVTTHERIFGGQQPGMIQYLHAADEKLAETITQSNKDLLAALTTFKESVGKEFTGVKADISKIKSDRRVERAYVAGAGAVLGVMLKAGLGKLGWHI